MGRLLNTLSECDLHIDNLILMKKTYGYIPTYYQLALMKALSMAQAGMVLHFFSELGSRDSKLMADYFGSPIAEEEVEEPKPTTNRISDLKKLL